MKKLFRTLSVVTLIFGVLSIAFAGGGGQATQRGVPGTPIEGGTLIIGEQIRDTLMVAKNPFYPANTHMNVLDFIYESLMYFNPILGVLEPVIATGYEWSADFKTLTFTIRDGV